MYTESLAFPTVGRSFAHRPPSAHHGRGARSRVPPARLCAGSRDGALPAGSATAPPAWTSLSKARPTPSRRSWRTCAPEVLLWLASTRSRWRSAPPRVCRASRFWRPSKRPGPISPSPPTWPRARIACVRCATPPIAATAIRSSTARTAGRASPSCATFPTTVPRPRCPASRCARNARRSTRTRSTGAFTPSPIACPACGPRIRLERDGAATVWDEAALLEARSLLAAGAIVAVKGLGGFHLACDASSVSAVRTLRRRKHREGKPFALMANDVETIARHAVVTPAARELLESPERPVLLLPRAVARSLAEDVAPARNRLGFMLPYTPLHHLLLEPAAGYPEVLVMTSGNLSDEPIAYEDEDARRRLGSIADAFLLHDRPIHVRCDDGVAAEFRGKVYFGRRSRGLRAAPGAPAVLRPRRCWRWAASSRTSSASAATTARFSAITSAISRIWRRCVRSHRGSSTSSGSSASDPQADRPRSPPGLSVDAVRARAGGARGDPGDRRAASPRPRRVVHGRPRPARGRAGDRRLLRRHRLRDRRRDLGRGVPRRGLPRISSVRRISAYVPLPGGDAAIRKPYRAALSWLRQADVPWAEDLAPFGRRRRASWRCSTRSSRRAFNAPPTSSMGRLFDAVAAIAGCSPTITYEAQAACELEAAASPDERGAYAFDMGDTTIDAAPVAARGGGGHPRAASRSISSPRASTTASPRWSRMRACGCAKRPG